MKSNFFSVSNIKSLFFENKTLRQTILKNTFWLWVAEAVDRGISFLVIILLARHFGPTIYGQWAFALSFVATFAILADFGFNTLTVREVARDKSKTAQYIDNMLAMKLILGLISFGLIVFSIKFFNKDAEIVKLVYGLGVYIIIYTFCTFFRAIFQANEKMQYEAACRAVQSISLLFLVVFFIINKSPIINISYAYIISAILGTVVFLIVIWNRFSNFFYEIDIKICKKILSEAWPFALATAFAVIYGQVDTIMLSIMKTDLVVGWYNSAYALVAVLSIIPGLLMTAVYPKLSDSFLNSKPLFVRLYKASLKYIFLVSIIIFPLLFLFSRPIILLLYGSAYINSVIIFRILLSFSFFLFVNSALTYVLYAMGRQISCIKIMMLGLVFNIILNLLFIPEYSYIGASIAAIIPQILICLLFFSSINKKLSSK